MVIIHAFGVQKGFAGMDTLFPCLTRRHKDTEKINRVNKKLCVPVLNRITTNLAIQIIKVWAGRVANVEKSFRRG